MTHPHHHTHCNLEVCVGLANVLANGQRWILKWTLAASAPGQHAMRHEQTQEAEMLDIAIRRLTLLS